MNPIKFIALMGCIAITILGINSCFSPAKPVVLTISYNLSLGKEITTIGELYRQENPHAILTFNPGGSAFLKAQIEQGAPVDIFIDITSKDLDDLKAKGFLIPNTYQKFIKDKMALIAPKNSTGISNFQDLTSDRIKTVVLAEPESTISGLYARELLTYFNIFETVKRKAIFVQYSQQVVKYIESGKADVGIAYMTDAKESDQLKIVAIAPENSHSPLVYRVAVIKSTKNLNEAINFVKFLFSNPAKSVFKESGFSLP